MIEITIPVLNEEKLLKQNVLVLHQFLHKEFSSIQTWSIVIADNGSTDHTRQIGEKLALTYPNLRYLRLDERGVGHALQTSWVQSKASIIGYMDLDLATDLDHLKEAMIAFSDGYDIVYATRLHPNSKVRGRSMMRSWTSRCFNFILRQYLGVHFSDGMCGFKFLRKEVYARLYENGAQSKGWFFSTELLVIAAWLKLKIYELPVTWTDSAESHVRIIPLAWQYLKAMRRLKQNKLLVAKP
ncbi:MAG: glycosyltransferase [Saprospiraceae bacterium]|nr:glycosyltransferase [Saprospiraceae bacterium]